MIEISHVSKTYPPHTQAVCDLTLTIPPGEIVGFLGPNGAGKTTTLKMITGILMPDEGNIQVCGFDVVKNSIEVKRRIGFVPDNPNMFLRLKGIEYLNFMADVYHVPTSIRRDCITFLSKTFELDHALFDFLQNYSHGMRQKVVLIGALLHSPEVLVLDEPMTGLDPKAVFTLKKMLRAQAEAKKTVFFSTHILDVAERFCDRVALIHKGQLLFYGTLEDMKKQCKRDGSLETLFLEMTENA